MREIKFRGKRIDNGEWVYGYLVKQFGAYKIYDDSKENFGDWIHEVDPETVGQFTELYDSTVWEQLTEKEKEKFYNEHCSEDGKTIKYRNIDDVKHLWKGREIYDGDILDCSYVNPMAGNKVERLFFVEYGKAAFMARCIGHSPFGDTHLHFENTKGNITGNIHDNPELMEVAE